MGKEKSNLEILKEVGTDSCDLIAHASVFNVVLALARITVEQEKKIEDLELSISTLQRQMDNLPNC